MSESRPFMHGASKPAACLFCGKRFATGDIKVPVLVHRHMNGVDLTRHAHAGCVNGVSQKPTGKFIGDRKISEDEPRDRRSPIIDRER